MITKFGEFKAENNGNGGVSLYVGDKKIIEFPNVCWWDKDAIENALEKHQSLVEKRLNERCSLVTKDNVTQVLQDVLKVLGNEDKGFYASRIKQCLNRLGSK